ncbi:MAG: lamin tail domain-containing protein [Akkermansiaceae bacterium]
MIFRTLIFSSLLPLHGALEITEFSANADESFLDSDGDSSDWIEIQNTGASPISTAGYILSDGTEWLFPDISIAPGEFLIVFASKKDHAIAGEELHANFSLSSDGESLTLSDPSGTVVSDFNYPRQFYGITYGSGGYFATPTPEAMNGSVDFTDYVRDTTFSVDRGFFEAPFAVEIASATPDASIYYTTDGSEPSVNNGTLYTVPISITTTTVLRAVATKTGLVSSNVDAQSYFFLEDVINQPQSPAGFPTTWGIDNSTANGATNQPRPGDYEMDPRVITQFGAAEAIAALKNHPTISVVMDPNDLWNESTDSATGGIYPNPYGGTGSQFRAGMGEPRDWERPCSVEFIGFEKVPSKKVNAGIRIAGNWARHPNRFKHHFRLTSRREYGPSKFEGELFSQTEVDTFDDFILRGGNSESWTFPGPTGNGPGTRANVQYVRDQFYKDAQKDMGHLTPGQEFFHLYLNGVYWGLYTLIERIDAHFLSQHLGGEEEDYDVMKQANVLSDGSRDDWDTMYAISRSGVSTPEKYAEIQTYLDLENFIDYILFNFWAGTVDWKNNWRAGRRSRNATGYGYQFFNWDGERGLGDQSGNRTFSFNSATFARSWSFHPNEMHHDLKLNPEYQIRFADRVQKHFFNNGTLSPERAALLYNARVEEIRSALILESARWGDLKRPSNPYTTENEWKDMLDYMNDNFFPRRNPIVLSQLRTDNLFPDHPAPNFNKHGGQVPDGFPLVILAETGTIYYTTDGSDPRLEGGAVNPNAMIGAGGLANLEVIAAGSTWTYNDDDVAIGTFWKEPAFDDDQWKTGAAPLGYGGVNNTTIATTLVDSPVVTAYFRQDFEVTHLAGVVSAFLEASLDGGGIFYLNGVEILRDNMAEGAFNHSTLATSDGNEGVFDRFGIPTEHLVEGTNTLAVELHNVRANSSDMGFDVRLVLSEVGDADLNISSGMTVKARALDGPDWSALTEAEFYLGAPASSSNLVISEILYNPSGTAEDEFIELLNISDEPVNLAGVAFTDGIEMAFPKDTLLGPGERLVLQKNVPPAYSGMLSNGGENLRLVARDGSVIHELEYGIDAPWPAGIASTGQSMVLTNPYAAPDHDDAANWLPSPETGGTPGTSDTSNPPVGADLQEFFFNGRLPEMSLESGVPTLIVPRNLSADGATIVIEVSTNLINWQPGGKYEGLVTLPDDQPAMTWSFSPTVQTQFVRARIVTNP